MMVGLNIDPRNPHGNPTPGELRALGVKTVRFIFRDPTPGDRPDQDILRFYRRHIEALAEAGIDSLVVLNHETCPHPPPASAPVEVWRGYVDQVAGRAAEIAQALAAWRPTFQVWSAPDLALPQRSYDSSLPPSTYGQLLQQTYQAIKAVDAGLTVITAGLVSGRPDWLAEVIQRQAGVSLSLGADLRQRLVGVSLPADGVALHPYAKRPSPAWPASDWGTGTLGDLIAAYQQITNLPLWVTEIGLDTLDDEFQAAYLRHFYNAVTDQFSGSVQHAFWFCYADGMAYPYGLVTQSGQPKPAYHAYRELATGKGITAAAEAQAARLASLDSLYRYARYLEQSIVFGTRDHALQRQMETDLRWKTQPLSKTDIRGISQHLLAGSSHALSQAEIDSLHALQQGRDLYSMLRSIVSATHQRTGALTGRIGVHTRISAETDHNAATNTDAIMRVLSQVQPGNRMSVMDQVKANADEAKLRAPDVFETDVYGRHSNGLIDNHAWNLQRLVRAIRNHGYQDRIILIVRLDGPDGGANVNPFNPSSLLKYELAIGKLIRYLEAMLPDVPFKIALGNEPDLPQERQWSDPHVDARAFILTQFAPAAGRFMKKMARQRPDVTFICPALSANMKHDYLAYYTAFFGDDRPENLVPGVHGYSADVATLPGNLRNLIEQQAEALRRSGRFTHVSGTEIGSGNPIGDVESLSEKGRFDDVVAWLLLSPYHQTPPGQDNNWSFRVDPSIIDPAAQHLGSVVNRSQNRVLRNIRERSGGALQILQGHAVERPAYGVEYVGHNTPTTMVAGQTRAVQITLRNISNRTWPAGGPHPVRLGYHWYKTNGAEVPPSLWDDNRTALPHDVLPGDAVTLHCNLNAPRTPDQYELRWDVVEELRTWFAWQGVATLNIEVNVVTEAPPVPSEPEPEPAPGPQPPEPPPEKETVTLGVRASHYDVRSGVDNILQAIDGRPETRWSSRLPQQPGMWFEIDLNQVRMVRGVALDNAGSPKDYPRGYAVSLSRDRSQWTEVARTPQNDRPLDIEFSPHPARYIRIEQIGQDAYYWWSIHGVAVKSSKYTPAVTASASHNNVLSGADNLAQALDGRPETRWSTRAVQQPGMWFELDLNQVRSVGGLSLDSAGSPNDYPRGYVVRLSTDHSQWAEVARNDRNDRALDISFGARPARYIRIEQTGSSDRWWSIHGVTVKE